MPLAFLPSPQVDISQSTLLILLLAISSTLMALSYLFSFGLTVYKAVRGGPSVESIVDVRVEAMATKLEHNFEKQIREAKEEVKHLSITSNQATREIMQNLEAMRREMSANNTTLYSSIHKELRELGESIAVIEGKVG